LRRQPKVLTANFKCKHTSRQNKQAEQLKFNIEAILMKEQQSKVLGTQLKFVFFGGGNYYYYY